MNEYGLAQLRCPSCANRLELHAFSEEIVSVDEATTTRRAPQSDRAALARVIRDGVLVCRQCTVWYPIASYVPVMLVFPIPFHDYFHSKHAPHFTQLAAWDPPAGTAKPGERSIQQTFTEEWDTVRDSELTFSYTKHELRELHRTVWLKWDLEPPAEVRRILNIGCGGLGAEAEALHDISRADVFGIDLNLTLLHAGPRFRQHPFFHLVIASLFHLPFERESFDLVYSQGVLHHTYSTHDAFRNSAQYVRPGGQFAIWVYALEDHLAPRGRAGWVQRLKYYGEDYLGLRFLISRLPSSVRGLLVFLISIVAHPFFKATKAQGLRWKLVNTQHSIRDRLTPRFAHKHSFNEVIEWYEQAGFTAELHSPSAYRRLFQRPLWGIGIRGTKGP